MEEELIEGIDEISEFTLKPATYEVRINAYDQDYNYLAGETATSYGTPETAVKYAKDLFDVVSSGKVKVNVPNSQSAKYLEFCVNVLIDQDGDLTPSGTLFTQTLEIDR